MIPIEPVFVGLLAAAFTFLFGQLVPFIEESVLEGSERLKSERYMEYALKEFRGLKKYRSRYAGDKGRIFFHADQMEHLGRAYYIMALPLMFYVVSIALLIWGYVVDSDIVVGCGLALLTGAFLLIGTSLCLRYWVKWSAYKRAARMILKEGFERIEGK